MASNLELVRSIYEQWRTGDFGSVAWASPGIEFAFADGPEPGGGLGIEEMARRYGDWLRGFKDFRAEPEEYIVVDPRRILVCVHNTGRGHSSGLPFEQRSVANLFEIEDGRVTKLVLYMDRELAFAELGLER